MALELMPKWRICDSFEVTQQKTEALNLHVLVEHYSMMTLLKSCKPSVSTIIPFCNYFILGKLSVVHLKSDTARLLH